MVDFNTIDLSPHVLQYQNGIDFLLSSSGLAKKVLIYNKLTPTVPTGEQFQDSINKDFRKPPWKSGSAEERWDTATIFALIRWNPSDYSSYSTQIQDPTSIVRLKTFITDVPTLRRAEFIIPNSDSRRIIGARFKLAGEPVPQGLREDRYAISFWERM